MPKDDELVPWGWPDRTYYLRNLYIKYKINNEDFEKLWAAQNGQCTCSKLFAHPFKKERGRMGYQPRIDYEHKRGADGKLLPCTKADIRGLLCSKCNRKKHGQV